MDTHRLWHPWKHGRNSSCCCQRRHVPLPPPPLPRSLLAGCGHSLISPCTWLTQASCFGAAAAAHAGASARGSFNRTLHGGGGPAQRAAHEVSGLVWDLVGLGLLSAAFYLIRLKPPGDPSEGLFERPPAKSHHNAAPHYARGRSPGPGAVRAALCRYYGVLKEGGGRSGSGIACNANAR